MTENNQYKWRQRKKRNSLLTVWVVAVIIVSALGTFAYEGLKESNPLTVAKKYIEETIGVDEYEIETGARSLNGADQFVQEYTVSYTADGKEEKKTLSLVQQEEKKYGIFDQWGLPTKTNGETVDLELIVPVDSQVLVNGVAPTNSEIKVDAEVSSGAVCYDLSGVAKGATIRVNGLPFDSFEMTVTGEDSMLDLTKQLVVGKNAQTQMTEVAKTMINELFTVAIEKQDVSKLSSLFAKTANKANLLKAITDNLYDGENLKVESLSFEKFEPVFGEVEYPDAEESAYLGIEMKLTYTCTYKLVSTKNETEASEESTEGMTETETEMAVQTEAEKKTVTKEATFYFKYISGDCIVGKMEVPNAIS